MAVVIGMERHHRPAGRRPCSSADRNHHVPAGAVCHVPAAVLCEGCAERLSIRVTPGGACRITFTAPASPASTATAKFVDINVEAEPARPARHRAPRLSDAKPEGPLHPQAGCFIFNGRRFCE